jgi:uncharacterized protein
MRIIALAATLTLTACASEPDARGLARDETLLRVAASGEAEQRPDVARFSAGVSSIAPSSEAATRLNNEKMGKVMGAVEALGVKRDDTRTEALSVNRIGYGRNRGQFEATNQVSVKVRSIDDAGKVIGAATAAGANILSGPDLTIDDREAAAKGAYTAAFKAARTRADAYAAAAGLKVKRVLTIMDGSDSGQPMPYEMAEQAADAARAVPTVSAPPIRPGLTTSSATVRVDFVLGE